MVNDSGFFMQGFSLLNLLADGIERQLIRLR
jgi:hypothetical protein